MHPGVSAAGDRDGDAMHLRRKRTRGDDVVQRSGEDVEVVGLLLPREVDVGVDRGGVPGELGESADGGR